jgi:hypothetical protein
MLKRLNNLLQNLADFAGHSFADSTVIERIEINGTLPFVQMK